LSLKTDTNYWKEDNIRYETEKFRIKGYTVNGDTVTFYDLYPVYFSFSDPAIAKFLCLDRYIYERPTAELPLNEKKRSSEKIL
jgi:hypothetical protein